MKKNFMPIFVLMFVGACSSQSGTKPISGNIPSTDVTVRAGRPVGGARSRMAMSRAAATQKFGVMERLYDTVWYQTEKDIDDGKVEVETEFIFFQNTNNGVPKVVEREMENGKLEEPEADDFKEITVLINGFSSDNNQQVNGQKVENNQQVGNQIIDTQHSNAAVVSVKEPNGEIEYEGYYLYTNTTLFVVEAKSQEDAKTQITAIVNNPHSTNWEDTDKYILSTVGLAK